MPDNLVLIASMTTDPTERIDRRAIAEADRTRDAALARDADARRQLGVAELALRRATEAADAAAAEGFNLQAERAVSEAEMTLKAVSRVAARAAAAAAEAPRLHRAAVGAAHATAAREAVRQTLLAYRVAAEAKAKITAAERRVQELQTMINSFANEGAHGLHAGLNRPGLLREVEGEVKFWEAHGFIFSEDAQ